MGKKPIIWGLFIAFLVMIFSVVPLLFSIYADFLWFEALGFDSVFMKILLTKIYMFFGFLFFAFLFIYINVYIANKGHENKRLLPIPGSWVLAGVAFVSFMLASIFKVSYMTILQYFNQVMFSTIDPVFMNDISFYVFTLPIWWLFLRYLMVLTFLTLIISGFVYFTRGHFNFKRQDEPVLDEKQINKQEIPIEVTTKAKYHLSGIVGFFFMLLALRYFLKKFEILFSETGIVMGAGFTDIYIALPVLTLLIIVSVIAAVLFFIWPAYFRTKGFVYGIIAAFIGVIIIGQFLVPAVIQGIKVQPNEIEVEKPYIERNLEFTRKAYGIDNVMQYDFPASESLTYEKIHDNRVTLDNIRLLDPRPLQQTYKQLQEIRLYYDFSDVDVDRYYLGDQYTEVMLSPRELDQNQLPSTAKTWVNQHLAYTHGYGLTLSPVNKFTTTGLPELYVKDIPPKTDIEELEITRPEIYYGEIDNDYIIVNSDYQEFDYPQGNQNQYTTYQGTGGVLIESFMKKLVMAFKFGDIKLFLTEYLTPSSKIMYDRNIRDRIEAIAPFIIYDQDPYMVISEGRLFWMVDGYTITNKYPYSESTRAFDYIYFNYIRNSVKVVVDAYNGDVSYYIIDKQDPIINTYKAIFPSLFKSIDDMPSGLKAHLRYPEELFIIQSGMYTDYHMNDPIVFYNKEDKWDIPNEIYGEGRQIAMTPYYIIMKLPNQTTPEFLLMTPFTPHKKDNMIGWMAAKSDEDYGGLVVYNFPKEKLIYGPMQVEARIDQDGDISEQLTLWDQRGSSVIRGNLIIIPIEDSLLYIEPLYLLAEQTELPELKRVIVYYGTEVVMEKDLDTALQKLFTGEIEAAAATKKASTRIEGSLVEQAVSYYDSVQEAMKNQDWVGVGANLDKLQEVLEQMKAENEPETE